MFGLNETFSTFDEQDILLLTPVSIVRLKGRLSMAYLPFYAVL